MLGSSWRYRVLGRARKYSRAHQLAGRSGDDGRRDVGSTSWALARHRPGVGSRARAFPARRGPYMGSHIYTASAAAASVFLAVLAGDLYYIAQHQNAVTVRKRVASAQNHTHDGQITLKRAHKNSTPYLIHAIQYWFNAITELPRRLKNKVPFFETKHLQLLLLVRQPWKMNAESGAPNEHCSAKTKDSICLLVINCKVSRYCSRKWLNFTHIGA